MEKNELHRSRNGGHRVFRPPQGAVRKTHVILISLVSILFGFVLGVWWMNHLATRGNAVAQDQGGRVAQLQAVLQKNPNDLDALIGLGNAYFDDQYHQEAIDAYSRALAINPKNADVRTDMGIMYRELKRFDEALEAFRRAARDDPAHVNSRFNIGIVLKFDKHDFPGAIQAWEDFLKVAPPEDERVIMVLREIDAMKKSLPVK